MHELPSWINEDPALAKKRRLTFLIKRAALYHNPQGSIRVLSMAAGFNANYLNHCSSLTHSIPRRSALCIEATVGNPEIFAASMLEQ